MRFSVEGSNVASTRSSGRGGSGAQIKMDKFEGIKKRIFVEDKGRGRNRTLRTAGGGGNGVLLEMRSSVNSGIGAPPRSAGGGGKGEPITMDKFEGGN